jgi:hypothetical protein
MSYVDAGYIVAIGGSFLYGFSLFLRRRRWERALRVQESSPEDRPAVAEHP